MAKPNFPADFDFEPDYDAADVAHDDAAQAEYEVGTDIEYDLPMDAEYEEIVQVAYEQVADPDYDAASEPEVPPVTAEPRRVLTAAPGFAFELGRPVLPLTQERPQLVVWRGHLKERHPATGLVHRIPVYRLADGHWDCYREEELRVA